jgi:hypothetical protein
MPPSPSGAHARAGGAATPRPRMPATRPSPNPARPTRDRRRALARPADRGAPGALRPPSRARGPAHHGRPRRGFRDAGVFGAPSHDPRPRPWATGTSATTRSCAPSSTRCGRSRRPRSLRAGAAPGRRGRARRPARAAAALRLRARRGARLPRAGRHRRTAPERRPGARGRACSSSSATSSTACARRRRSPRSSSARATPRRWRRAEEDDGRGRELGGSVLAALPGTVFLDAPELYDGVLGDAAGAPVGAAGGREVVSFGRDPLSSSRAPRRGPLGYYRAKLDDFAAEAETWLRDGYAVHVLLKFERTGRYLASGCSTTSAPAGTRASPTGRARCPSCWRPAPRAATATRRGARSSSPRTCSTGPRAGASSSGCPARAVHDAAQLTIGDYLIHPDHGIGASRASRRARSSAPPATTSCCATPARASSTCPSSSCRCCGATPAPPTTRRGSPRSAPTSGRGRASGRASTPRRWRPS